MSTNWTNSGGNYEQAPLGPHTAICTQIIDLGTQESKWNDEVVIRRQNLITWELPEELREDDTPFKISKFYTASLSEKSNLYKDLTSWIGRAPAAPFDPKKLLGKGCQVIITANKNDKHVVSAVAGLKKGEKAGKPNSDTVFFSLDEYDEGVFDSLSDGIKKIIMKSPEYAAIINGGAPDVVEEEDDDFGF